MPSTRRWHAFALVALLTLSGCLGGSGFLGLGAPTATVENRAATDYRVSVTVVHTETPWRDVPIELQYENGTVERTTVAPGRTAEDPRAVYFVPENVTEFRVRGGDVEHWNVSLSPGQSVTTNLTSWRPGDLVLVEWTRADGTVVRVKAAGCRTGLRSFERHVDTRRGGGGGETSCTKFGP